jgi:hypothetical protein
MDFEISNEEENRHLCLNYPLSPSQSMVPCVTKEKAFSLSTDQDLRQKDNRQFLPI